MGDKDKKTDWPERTFRIPPELLERLDVYCKKNGHLEDVRHREGPGEILGRQPRERVKKKEHPVPKARSLGTGCFIKNYA